MGDGVLHEPFPVSDHARSRVDHGQDGEHIGVLMVNLLSDLDAAEEFSDLLRFVVVAEEHVEDDWRRGVDLIGPEDGLGRHSLVDSLGREMQMHPVELALRVLAQELQNDRLRPVEVLQLVVELGLFEIKLELRASFDCVEELQGLSQVCCGVFLIPREGTQRLGHQEAESRRLRLILLLQELDNIMQALPTGLLLSVVDLQNDATLFDEVAVERKHDLADHFVEALPDFFWRFLFWLDGREDIDRILAGDERIVATSLIVNFGCHFKHVHDLLSQIYVDLGHILDEHFEFSIVIGLFLVNALDVCEDLGTNPLEAQVGFAHLKSFVEGLESSIQAFDGGGVPLDVVIAEGQVLPNDDGVFVRAESIQDVRHRVVLADSQQGLFDLRVVWLER